MLISPFLAVARQSRSRLTAAPGDRSGKNTEICISVALALWIEVCVGVGGKCDGGSKWSFSGEFQIHFAVWM